jgi:hypothetical protein
MLDLMLRLQLEHYSLTQDDSLLEDSCMLEIKASSNPVVAKSAIHLNSLKKVNTCFSQFGKLCRGEALRSLDQNLEGIAIGSGHLAVGDAAFPS